MRKRSDTHGTLIDLPLLLQSIADFILRRNA